MREYQCTLIRHGMTAGNKKRKFIGTTDEPLLEGERLRLAELSPPAVEKVFVSPMKRCLETAEILYPGQEHLVIPEFREIDFGEGEYLSHEEMDGLPWYQEFLDSGGESAFPGGETRSEFIRRILRGAEKIGPVTGDIAMVVHGGTIMALLHAWTEPGQDFYHWMCGNGAGWSGTIRAHEKNGYRITNLVRFPEEKEQ